MCDYSLHEVDTRPAQVGDVLVTTSFPNAATRGFSALGEPKVAVCLLPGTEIAFEKEVTYTHAIGDFLPRSRFGKVGAATARFRQINVDVPNTHRDALEFANGKVFLVTRLRPGQHATVLQLPAQARVAEKAPTTVQPVTVP